MKLKIAGKAMLDEKGEAAGQGGKTIYLHDQIAQVLWYMESNDRKEIKRANELGDSFGAGKDFEITEADVDFVIEKVVASKGGVVRAKAQLIALLESAEDKKE